MQFKAIIALVLPLLAIAAQAAPVPQAVESNLNTEEAATGSVDIPLIASTDPATLEAPAAVEVAASSSTAGDDSQPAFSD
ncbi:uncharacterized protein EV422DRAFT_515601 [Fimicolochytrium jonesii]|uniref:uncharacterized protein n=1 Tax=Fimicolochytrium jonesii TaxID=1396493 RepID=UPI0022FE9602|nr:uncharacterized protein EV422DRAFT_515601 [Fimicolochytrium jonesii]KAI8826166.1 hypothetical protein EV422DRAFT_515601 [Fimicolochytrium jonesii]